MKYSGFIRNARSKAEKFFRSGFAFLVFLAAALVLTVSSVRLIDKYNEKELKARRGIYLMMESDMAKCAQIGIKMRYAGADIEGELLPELKTYLYSLKNMTEAFIFSFGEEYSPLNPQFLSKVDGACERLERDLRSGYASDTSEEALTICLGEFSKILNKWDFD
ncbi:MAG: hypothetical protein IIW08_05665 [Clostridia bacterium]|nr:hypothetical protein [Clostridia bacterium]